MDRSQGPSLARASRTSRSAGIAWRLLVLTILAAGIVPASAVAAPLIVTLKNALSGAVLPGEPVLALLDRGEGPAQALVQVETDASGRAVLDVEGLGADPSVAVLLRASPYGSPVTSAPVRDTGSVDFPVGALELTLISGADGARMADTGVGIHRLLPDGSTQLVTQGRTGADGVARLDPPGLGSGAVFFAQAPSRLTGEAKRSGPITIVGAREFVVGNEALVVTLKNALSGAVLPGEPILALVDRGEGPAEALVQVETDASGRAVLDVEGLGADPSVAVLLRASPYGSPVTSAPVRDTGSVDFPVGALELTLISGADGARMADTGVGIHRLLPDGSTQLVTQGRTGADGVVRLDPPGLGSGAEFFAQALSRLTGETKRSGPITIVGAREFVVGNEALVVTLKNALSGAVLPGEPILALVDRGEGPAEALVQVETDASGRAVLDVEGLGADPSVTVLLRATPYGSPVTSAPVRDTGSLDFAVGALELTLISGADGTRMADTGVGIHRLLPDGSTQLVTQGRTGADGVVRLDPPGLGSGAEFFAQALSRLTGETKRSGPITIVGAREFVVGNAALVVTLKNALSGAVLPGEPVLALLDRGEGPAEALVQVETDAAGRAVLDVEGLGVDPSVAVLLRATPYGSPVTSAPVRDTGSVDFAVGALELTLISGVDGTRMADTGVGIHRLLPDGSTQLVTQGRTGADGVVRLDPPGLGSGAEFFAQALSRLTGETKRSEAITSAGAREFVVGNEALVVTLKNALSGAVLPGEPVLALLDRGEGPAEALVQVETDASGRAVLDVEGLGDDPSVAVLLRATPYGSPVTSAPVRDTGSVDFAVGALELTLISGADGARMADTGVGIHRLLPDGSTQLVTLGRTGSDGVARLDPPGLGSGAEFFAQAPSRLTGETKRSGPITSAGAREFVVGNEALVVTLKNALSGAVLPGEPILALLDRGEGPAQALVQVETDASGRAVLDVEGLGADPSVAVLLRASPYGSPVTSAPVRDTGSVDFPVGALELTLISGADGARMADTGVGIHRLLPDGSTQLVTQGRTGADGVVRLDPPGLGSGAEFFAQAPSRLTGEAKRSGPITIVGAREFVVGNEALVVTLKNALSGAVLPGEPILALVDRGEGPAEALVQVETDASGRAVLDVEGLGADPSVAVLLRASPYGSPVTSAPVRDTGSVDFPVGALELTLISGADGARMADTGVGIHRLLPDGSTQLVTQGRTGADGVARLDPPGLGSGAEFFAQALSRLTGETKRSGPITIVGAREFVVGNEALVVTLKNALSGAVLPGEPILALVDRGEGPAEALVQVETDASGRAVLDVEGLGADPSVAVLLRASPYGSPVTSAPVRDTGSVDFAVGALELTLISGADGTRMADTGVRIHRFLPDGSQPLVTQGRTGSDGVVRLDPPGLGSGAVFFAQAPSRLTGEAKRSEAITIVGAREFVVGNAALVVTLKNALSGAVLPGEPVLALVDRGEGPAEALVQVETDASGRAVLDVEGLGADPSVAVLLRATPYGSPVTSAPVRDTGSVDFAVGALELTLISGADGTRMADTGVRIHRFLPDGSQPLVTQGRTGSDGVVRLDPPGLGSGAVFFAQAPSRLTGETKRSEAITIVGAREFVVGNEALVVTLKNALSGAVLPGEPVLALLDRGEGPAQALVQVETDASGRAVLDVEGLGADPSVAVLLRASPYGSPVTSAPVRDTGSVDFPVGALELTLISGADGARMADTGVGIHRLLPDGSTQLVTQGRTGADGVARLDPPGLGSGAVFFAQASSPVTGQSRRSSQITTSGAVEFVVGNRPLDVTVVDAITGAPVSAIRVSAHERLPDGATRPRDHRITDASGLVRFDLEGLGATEPRIYFLTAEPFNGGRVSSADLSGPGSFEFRVGAVPVTLLDDDEGRPIGEVRLTALERLVDGRLKQRSTGITGADGIVRFDPPGLEAGRPYAFRAHGPFGNGHRFHSQLVTRPGPFLFSISRGDDPRFDGDPPALSVTSPLAGATVDIGGFVVTGTATDERGVEQVAVVLADGTAVVADLDAQTGAFRAAVPGTRLVLGSLPFTVRAVDARANEATAELAVDVTKDLEGPILVLDSHAPGDVVAATGFLVSGTVTDQTGVETLEATVGDAARGTTVTGRPVPFDLRTGTWHLAVLATDVSPGEAVDLALTATDGSGNATTLSVAFEVNEAQANTRHLIDRITFGASIELMHEVSLLGASAFLEQQLAPSGIDDSAFEAALASSPVPSTVGALQIRQLEHAIRSRRQLLEVMTRFWDNHFNTDVNAGNSGHRNTVAFEVAENEGFRAHALGRFRDLLEVSAKSPSMLIYLDTISSVVSAPNENHARELLELHTMKVDGGFTQTDVEEVARALTGWQVLDGQFFFNAADHDTGEKVVLGNVLPAGRGVEDGEAVLDILGIHPATASFVCEKLSALLVSDEPTSALVRRCADTFLAASNDPDQIGQVVRMLVTSPEFSDPANERAKIKDPLEMVAALARNLDADGNLGDLRRHMQAMGLRPFENPVPTGYPESGEHWLNSSLLLERMKLADSVAFNLPGGDRTSIEPVVLLRENGAASADAVISLLFSLLFDSDTTALERAIALDVLTAGGTTVFDMNAPDADSKLRSLLGIVLSFPGYQEQ